MEADDDFAVLDRAKKFVDDQPIVEIWRCNQRVAVLDDNGDAPLRQHDRGGVPFIG